MADDTREFKNSFPDYDKSPNFLDSNLQLTNDFKETLSETINYLLTKFQKEIGREKSNDQSVYTGITGYSLLHLHLSEYLRDASHLTFGLRLLEPVLDSLKGHRVVTFLCGDAGPLAVGAVIKHKLKDDQGTGKLVSKLKSLLPQVTELSSDLPDELLYGRAGYLYALLFVEKHLGASCGLTDTVKQTVGAILASGQVQAREEKGKSGPLAYRWHGKPYLGAAHGTAGILYLLLQAREHLDESQLWELVKPSVEYVLSLQFRSGNFPSSIGSDYDKLVHWCHGAPGAVYLMIQAHQVFGEQRYLDASLACGDVIWRRGLLRKGYGLCHGTAGNGYVFLALYKATGDPKHLYRAAKFAEWCFDYGSHGCRIADRPYSLLEGLAGTIYFLTDVMAPESAAFPAFQL